METSASRGSIATQYFGDQFDPDKVDTNVNFKIIIKVPHPASFYNKTATLMVNFDKISLLNTASYGEEESFKVNSYTKIDLPNYNSNFSPPLSTNFILNRKLSKKYIRNSELDLMAGFKLTWDNDMETNYLKYRKKETTMEFVRYRLHLAIISSSFGVKLIWF